MSIKRDARRIERLEAFALSLKVEDARRRHLEALSKMSDEEVASLVHFALKHFTRLYKEDKKRKADELFRSGLAATEHLEERARLGWKRYCETGAQAAVVDFYEWTAGKVTPSGSPWHLETLFEGLNPSRSRKAGVRFHKERLLASESEKKALWS